jgi:PhoH-like ATPase
MAKAKKSAKTFLLDTNILMRYPLSIYGFADNNVVVTATTIEELDNLKTAPGEKGFEARQALATIDELRKEARQKQKTTLSEGLKINNGKGCFRIENDHISAKILPQGWSIEKADNRILSCASELDAILVTEDRGLSIKADEIGVMVQNYHNAELEDDHEYTGRGEAYVPPEMIDTLYKDGCVGAGTHGKNLTENEYLTLYDNTNPQHTVLARYSQGLFKKLLDVSSFGKVKPLNTAQKFALDALLCPADEIGLVILEGEARTAKTFLSVVGAMYGYQMDMWDQIIATRNNVEFDKEIGALPGTEEDKVSPLLRGLTDNLRAYLRIQGTADEDIQRSVDDYLDTGIISIESMGFMRGKSLSNTFLILDEAQNANRHQIKGIITRAGKDTKIVVCGDPTQIDNVKLDRKNNGLIYAKNKMMGSVRTAIIEFYSETECFRSELAKEASIRMRDDFA